MLHISKVSKQSAEQVLQHAVTYFGADGMGLTVEQQSVGAVQLAGAGGHVLVQAAPLDNGSEVDIQTQEFEYDIQQFLQKI